MEPRSQPGAVDTVRRHYYIAAAVAWFTVTTSMDSHQDEPGVATYGVARHSMIGLRTIDGWMSES